ncbi:interferon-gamma-inducible GTPase 10-like [Mixophyes fleayi]|uniref:interferon-gamma-inducible GTPase 10-like n=1 Tax=Mixophyes fleayi TaxID=3061075 RepID=UPI003F4E2256
MDNEQMSGILSEEDIQEIKTVLENKNLAEAIESVKTIITNIENVPLNVAITGESGSGKSTFINVIRSLNTDEEEGAAITGVVETTMEPTPFSHLKYKNVKFWDLPGIGTANFKAADYLEKVHFSQYDFFIIIASERFKENHIHLAQAIHSMNKKFYFIRSKVDVDLESSRKRRNKSFNEEEMLQQIRVNCIISLRDGGVGEPHVFVLSLMDLQKYDFNRMQNTLEEELPRHKRHMFLLSLPNITLQVLERKRKILNKLNWKWAFLFSAYSTANHTKAYEILQDVLKNHLNIFGLDNNSLIRLSNTFGKDINDLKSVIKSPFASTEINQELIQRQLTKNVAKYRISFENFLSYIPIIGDFITESATFFRSYIMLCESLKDFLEDASNVLQKAMEDST